MSRVHDCGSAQWKAPVLADLCSPSKYVSLPLTIAGHIKPEHRASSTRQENIISLKMERLSKSRQLRQGKFFLQFLAAQTNKTLQGDALSLLSSNVCFETLRLRIFNAFHSKFTLVSSSSTIGTSDNQFKFFSHIPFSRNRNFWEATLWLIHVHILFSTSKFCL